MKNLFRILLTLVIGIVGFIPFSYSVEATTTTYLYDAHNLYTTNSSQNTTWDNCRQGVNSIGYSSSNYSRVEWSYYSSSGSSVAGRGCALSIQPYNIGANTYVINPVYKFYKNEYSNYYSVTGLTLNIYVSNSFAGTSSTGKSDFLVPCDHAPIATVSFTSLNTTDEISVTLNGIFYTGASGYLYLYISLSTQRSASEPYTGSISQTPSTSEGGKFGMKDHWYNGGTAASVTGGGHDPSLTYGTSSTGIPDAPTNLVATWDFGTHGLYLNQWCPQLDFTDNSTIESFYRIEKATDNGFTQNVYTLDWYYNVNPYYDIFSAWNTGNPTTLYYRVAAGNENGVSSWSNTASLAVQTGYSDVIPRVQNLHGTLHITQNIPSYILLEWDTYEGTASGFYIQRASNQNFTGIVYHFLNQNENNPLYPTLNDDGFIAFTDIYGIGNLNEAGNWYYRIMARNLLGSNTVVINTNPNSPSITVIGSEWSNIAIVAVSAQDLEDINILPQPTIPPTNPNPFPIPVFTGNPAFPYIALLVSALLLFVIAVVVGRGHIASIYVGIALVAADLGVFTAMSWINPIPLVVVIAAAVIFLVVKFIPVQGS